MPHPELYICRHGETEWNAADRMQGWLNSPLTMKGEMQAARQGEILRSRDLTGFTCLSSPSGRAFQTAGIALGPLVDEIRTDDRLREIGVGDWSGLYRKDLPLPEGEDPYIQQYEMAPGGEGFDGLRARVEGFLADLQEPSVIFTHGITSRMMRSLLVGQEALTVGTAQGGQGVVWHVKDGAQSLLQ